MTITPAILGWDIGGVNTKVVRLETEERGRLFRTASLPYEIKRDPRALAATLVEAASRVGSRPEDLHAVTMTAELSQAFHTKREGVGSILDGVSQAFPGTIIRVYSLDGFVAPETAREQPLSVAAANWSATASLVARSTPTCVVVDIGSTSADLIPVVNRRVVAQGRTDPERLLSGELVYTGALRTPVEALAHQVPLWGGTAGVAADGFAISGDVHLWLGRLAIEDYTCPTPDGLPATRHSAGQRLARVVCGDGDMVNEHDIDGIASALAAAQVQTVARALERILVRQPSISTAVVTGLGDFIAAEAAGIIGLETISLEQQLGPAARIAPAAAVAWLLRQSMEQRV